MGVVRNVIDDLYSKVEQAFKADLSSTIEPDDQRLGIFQSFATHMVDPRAPEEVMWAIEEMGGTRPIAPAVSTQAIAGMEDEQHTEEEVGDETRSNASEAPYSSDEAPSDSDSNKG
jgi:hypothetical protein